MTTAKRNFITIRRLTSALALILAAGAAQAEPLTVYSALDEDQVVELMDAFKAEHPDIEVDMIVSTGGTIISRLIAEKANPRADILFGAPVSGLPPTSLMVNVAMPARNATSMPASVVAGSARL